MNSKINKVIIEIGSYEIGLLEEWSRLKDDYHKALLSWDNFDNDLDDLKAERDIVGRQFLTMMLMHIENAPLDPK